MKFNVFGITCQNHNVAICKLNIMERVAYILLEEG